AVDNQPSVIFSLGYIFTGPRYDLTGVENGDAALARLDSGLEQYDIIIVDQKMPHLSGVELVDEMRKRGVNSKIMVLSAHLSSEVRAAYERMDVHPRRQRARPRSERAHHSRFRLGATGRRP